MTQAALSVEGLTSGYGEAMVIRNVGFKIAPAEILALLGKNGIGKSTLLRTIMGYLRKGAGRVVSHGRDITAAQPYRVARLGIGYVAQEKALFQDLTVEENIRLAIGGRKVAAALETVGEAFPFLTDRLWQRAGTLSGGEQKMLLMARTLATGADLILIDEISEGLQPTMVARIASVIRAAREERGTSFLLVEQNLSFALATSDRYHVLQGGEIVASGASADTGAAASISKYLSV
jgi:branched-chain amino acid transport system ATP-binding protein